jgi:hypothetical protein
MYSVQHVLWRGAMALSLMVVAGVGAGVSAPSEEQSAEECREVQPAVAARHIDALPHYQLDTVVVIATKQTATDEA